MERKPNRELVEFIREAKRRGFKDFEIKEPLLGNGWLQEEINLAFNYFRDETKLKEKVTIYLDKEVLEAIVKRSKKNLFTINEQVEDILRRSVVNSKKTKTTVSEKLDDMLIGVFSRRKRKAN